MKSIAIALLCLGAATLIATSALESAAYAQGVIQPAGYAKGIVRGVDPQSRTLTIGAETYQVGRNTTSSIYEIHPGDEVEITYIVERGRWVALDVRRTGERGGLLLFQYP